jgi:hypothetical protein
MEKVPRIFRSAGFSAAWLLVSLSALGQVSPSSAPSARAATLQESVQALAGEVKELNATIQELRAEVLRSRQETRDLRADLDRTIENLSSKSSAESREVTSAKSIPEARPATQEATAPPKTFTKDAPEETRLNRLEEDQQLLQAKVDEQHQTKVESASKYRVKLSGIALFNLFGNSGAVDNQDVPNLALPRSGVGTGGSVGATVRQSEIGLEVYGPTLAGARASANVDLDFMGGFSNVSNGVTSNVVRLRTATMRLDWTRTSVIAGQDVPFFSPLSPTSFASLGYPAFADAGNLWTWIPQVRVEHRLSFSEADGLLLQGGILDPLSGEPPYAQFYRTPQGGEQSRIPALGSRVAWTHGGGDRPLTVGIGGYYSRQNYGAGRATDAWAGTADWNAPLGRRFALSGEFYRGRALGGLGAAQGRSVLFDEPESNPASDFIGLETVGGWTQLKFKATEAIEFNAAYGQDNPLAHDRRYYYFPSSYGYASIGKNQNALVNVIYRPRSDLLFALEYKYLDTLQISDARNTAGSLNLSMGVLF